MSNKETRSQFDIYDRAYYWVMLFGVSWFWIYLIGLILIESVNCSIID